MYIKTPTNYYRSNLSHSYAVVFFRGHRFLVDVVECLMIVRQGNTSSPANLEETIQQRVL